MKALIVVYTAVILLFFSCKKSEEPVPQVFFDMDVIILNEGNFGQGNATIDLYNSRDKSQRSDVFRSNNQGRPIGDVVHSMYVGKDTGFVVVNNSQKIEMIDLNDFKSLGTINGLNSPRYFLPISSKKAYVSDLYSNSIQVIDIQRKVVNSAIQTNGWTEQMAKIEDTVYVADMTNNELIRINSKVDTLLGRSALIRQPNSVVVDKNNTIWVLCSGGFDEVLPRLYQISTSGNVIQFFEFQSVSMSPGNLIIDGKGEELYYLNGGVFSHPITATQLANNPVIPKNGRLLYSLAIHPSSEELYVADAIDYQQNGVVYRYLKSGELVHQFRSGIIPGSFQFIP